MNRHNCWRLLAPVLLVVLGGCGSSGLYKTSGRLTYKGQPVPSTYVIFQPEDPAQRASRGLTDDDGRFKLTHSQTEIGCLPGQHTVVLKYRVSAQEELHEIPPKASKELQAVIASYGDVKRSPLRYEINKNGQVIDIDLK
jgi:hypothetical protein